jgi:hypothetical protein
VTLYSNAFTGYRDATGTIFLGYINASSTTTVNLTIGMQAWTSSPTFTLLGTQAQLPPGVTLSSGGVLSGTINTGGLNPGLNRYTFSALVTYTMTDPSAGSSGTLTTGTSQQAFIYDVMLNTGATIQDVTVSDAIAADSANLFARSTQLGTTIQDNTGSPEGIAIPGVTNQAPVANTNVYINTANIGTAEGNLQIQGNATEIFNNYPMNAYVYSSSTVNYGATNQDNFNAAEGLASPGSTNWYPVANTNVYINTANVVAINIVSNLESSTTTFKPASLNALRTPMIIIG